jgi:hypothetical protein
VLREGRGEMLEFLDLVFVVLLLRKRSWVDVYIL